MQKPNLILIDGSSFLYRAFYAMPELSDSMGQPVGAIFGVGNMLRRLLNDYPNTPMICVFDAPGKTFRDDIYSEYKANRSSMPDDLRVQTTRVHQMVEAMGIGCIVQNGVEADDVIGTLADKAETQKISVLIASGDKDLAQLVTKNVVVIDTMRDKDNQLLDIDGVEKRFGVRPDQIIDYLTLVGDTSDNIPGVPGVGPKTAVKWLTQYDTLDNLVTKAEEINGKIGEKFRAHIDNLALSKDLVTIRRDIHVDYALENITKPKPNYEVLEPLLRELGFRRWHAESLKQLHGNSDVEKSSTPIKATPVAERKYIALRTVEAVSEWLSNINNESLLSVDTETTDVNPHFAKLVGISLSTTINEGVYIPIEHVDKNGVVSGQINLDTARTLINPILSDEKIAKVGQNLKYDLIVLKRHGFDLNNIHDDTMLMSYLIDSSTRHDLDTLSNRWLDIQPISYDSLTGTGRARISFAEVDIDTATPYAAEDADLALQLESVLRQELADKNATELYRDVELPLLSVLAQMERNGVLVDEQELNKQSAELGAQMEEFEKTAYTLAGEEFNLSSPKQLQKILFEKLKLPIISKTPGGQPSTAESVLDELAIEHELPDTILQYRSLYKLKSTYTDKLPQMISSETGRIHTSYNQAVTVTGRLSSSDPNLQNIPIRTAEGRKIRDAFIAAPGNKIAALDYSQIELRIMAHLSQDSTLIDAFNNDRDIHASTAEEVFGKDYHENPEEYRRRAKAINFGLIYGMSAFGLARQLRISRPLAEDYIKIYFDRYPSVKEYMDRMRALAHEQKYVETILGRRLYIHDIRSSNYQRRQYAERTAINAPMQGSAADIIKIAMLKVYQTLKTTYPNSLLIMQVHDELVLEAPQGEILEIVNRTQTIMENALKLTIPLKVQGNFGVSWGQAH